MLASSSHMVDAKFHFYKWQLLHVNFVIQLKKPFNEGKTRKLKIKNKPYT